MERELFGFQDELLGKLIGAVIGMARATFENQHLVNERTFRLVLESFLAAEPNKDINKETVVRLTEQVEAEKGRLAPGCASCTVACGKNNNYDMKNLWDEEEEILSLKLRILCGIRKLAAVAYYMDEAEYKAAEMDGFVYTALFAVGTDDWDVEDLLPIAEEAEEKRGKYEGVGSFKRAGNV